MRRVRRGIKIVSWFRHWSSPCRSIVARRGGASTWATRAQYSRTEDRPRQIIAVDVSREYDPALPSVGDWNATSNPDQRPSTPRRNGGSTSSRVDIRDTCMQYLSE